jgi:hypothetical protein
MSFKRCQVVMISTKQKSGIMLDANKKTLFSSDYPAVHVENNHGIQNMHLYILSDEELKEGDWFYHTIGGICHCAGIKDNGDIMFHDILTINSYPASATEKYIKKIIATTNKSLKPFWGHPKPSNSFIEIYIERYNAGTPIQYVNVEYVYDDSFKNHPSAPGMLLNEHNGWKLKVSSKDNTITIRKNRTTYTQEELMPIFLDIMNLGMSLRQDQLSGHSGRSGNEVLKEWLELNLLIDCGRVYSK